MRSVAPLLVVAAWFAVRSGIACAEDSDFPIGKPASWEIVNKKPPDPGQLMETPNQCRQRLGEPIVASYPAPEYGEAVETPNQRRERLGEPLPPSAPPEEYGSLEETPNHLRQRMAAADEIANSR